MGTCTLDSLNPKHVKQYRSRSAVVICIYCRLQLIAVAAYECLGHCVVDAV